MTELEDLKEPSTRLVSSVFLRRWFLIFLVLLTFIAVTTFAILVAFRYVNQDIALIQAQLADWEIAE